jgi:hypothetical protein
LARTIPTAVLLKLFHVKWPEALPPQLFRNGPI